MPAARLDRDLRVQAILERAPDAVVAMDAAGTVTYWNARAEALFGWTADAAVGRTVAELVVPEPARRAHWAGLERILRTGESRVLGRAIEVDAQDRDGSLIPVELTISQLEDGGTTFVAFVRDIRARREAEVALFESQRELRRSNAELEQYAHTVSHDLAEPLRTIEGFARLLRSRHHDRLPADALGALEEIDANAARMRELLDALLDYARVGHAELRRVPVALTAVAREVVADLSATIEARGAAVEIEALPRVEGDPALLGQVLHNLILNAVKFAAPDRAPEVTVAADARCTVAVIDRGIGIPPEHADRAFGLFERLDAGERFPGTGVGLALVKRVVDRHGGAVEIRPTPGGGTTVCVSLPPP